jgi:hypothetical protein
MDAVVAVIAVAFAEIENAATSLAGVVTAFLVLVRYCFLLLPFRARDVFASLGRRSTQNLRDMLHVSRAPGRALNHSRHMQTFAGGQRHVTLQPVMSKSPRPVISIFLGI